MDELNVLAGRLEGGGFIAGADEAKALMAAAAGDSARLEQLVRRRLAGEPLAWITGTVLFCGAEIRVDTGVYVPRWHTEALAQRAAQRCPPAGIAVDLCTGSGAVAATISRLRPRARVVGTDIDERAVACARANGVETYRGDLFDGLPAQLLHSADVLVGVVPYVPIGELQYLQRDTLTFETPLAYVGGADGTDLLRRAVTEGPRWLRPGGVLILELGGVQADLMDDELSRCGYTAVRVLHDQDGDVRGIEATGPGV